MVSPTTPYIQVDLILPAGRDIMLVSNDKDCFNAALQVIRGHESHLKSDKLQHADSNMSAYEKHKAWIDINSEVDTRKLIPQLVEGIRRHLEEQNRGCEVRMTLDE